MTARLKEQFTLHLDRGIGYLAGDSNLENIEDLITLAVGVHEKLSKKVDVKISYSVFFKGHSRPQSDHKINAFGHHFNHGRKY